MRASIMGLFQLYWLNLCWFEFDNIPLMIDLVLMIWKIFNFLDKKMKQA